MIVRISDDALACALGADELARAFVEKGHEVQRTSSWGICDRPTLFNTCES